MTSGFISIRTILVGDTGVGKKRLAIFLGSGIYPEDYIPTCIDDIGKNMMIDGQPVNFSIDFANGSEDYERLRPLMYNGADVFILAFSLTNPSSMEHLRTRWLPEIRRTVGFPNFVVAGLQADGREESINAVSGPTVSTEDGQRFANSINSRGYFECSAKRNEHTDDLMIGVYRAFAMKKSIKKPAEDKSPQDFCLVQ